MQVSPGKSKKKNAAHSKTAVRASNGAASRISSDASTIVNAAAKK